MLHALIFILLAGQPQATADWTGQVVSVAGDARISRQGQQYRVVNRGGLLPGDELQTARNGGASFALNDGTFVYLGADTQLRIEGEAVRMIRGEIRVVTSRSGTLDVLVPEGVASLQHGAHRIQVLDSKVRLATEAGTASLRRNSPTQTSLASNRTSVQSRLSDQSAKQISRGQEIRMIDGQIDAVSKASDQYWTVSVARLQQQGIDDAVGRKEKQLLEEENANQPQQMDREANQPVDEQTARSSADEPPRRQPEANASQYGAVASIASTSSGLSASGGIGASGGLFADANQSTNQGILQPGGGAFPGNIHLVTAETLYSLGTVKLNKTEQAQIFGGGTAYFSIGTGKPPTGQVTTDFNTASNATPTTFAIPGLGSDFHIVRLDQFGAIDSVIDPTGALANNVGITGLVGTDPAAPTISGTTPLLDTRSKINDGATFALGEIVLRPDKNSLSLGIRRSDQDRTIVKDPGADDAQDKVTTNPDVDFVDTVDPRFLPAAPTVKIPKADGFSKAGTGFSQLNNVRRAAVTTIMANQLHDYAKRTNNTRFVVDGKIVDISGYRKK